MHAEMRKCDVRLRLAFEASTELRFSRAEIQS